MASCLFFLFLCLFYWIGFTTLDNFEAAWISEDKKVYRIVTDKGPCKTKSLAGASLS